MKHKDLKGNEAVIGGFVEDEQGGKAEILQILERIMIIGQWHMNKVDDKHINGNVLEIASLIKNGYNFLPKPEEPKREIPPDGTPVWILDEGVRKGIRISSGTTQQNCLMCYCDGDMHIKRHDSLFPQEEWEVIK